MDIKSKNHIKFQNEEEVMEHYLANKEENKVVLFEGVVYNVKDYAPGHPGGDHFLLDRLGKDIKEDFEEAEHTKSALKVMQSLPIAGKIENESASTSSQEDEKEKTLDEFGMQAMYGLKMNKQLQEKYKFDYSKGMLYQIFTANLSFDEYCTFINEPKTFFPERDIRYFDHPYLEVFTKCPWYVVLIAWTPVLLWCATQIY